MRGAKAFASFLAGRAYVSNGVLYLRVGGTYWGICRREQDPKAYAFVEEHGTTPGLIVAHEEEEAAGLRRMLTEKTKALRQARELASLKIHGSDIETDDGLRTDRYKSPELYEWLQMDEFERDAYG